MSSDNNNVSLGKAIEAFMESPKASAGMRAELSRFAMLCGRGCPMFTLTTAEAREFVMEVSRIGERRKRAEMLETFFCFAKEKEWIRINPANDIIMKKEPKPKQQTATPKNSRREPIQLSPEGRQQIEAEVKALLAEKERVIAQVKAAREEGDLKENAGYHDARERLGLIEGRLREKADILSRGVHQE